MVVKWEFFDGSTTYTFEVNPNDGGLPGYSKNIQYANTTAPDGNVVVFAGRDEPRAGSFSGVTLSEAQHNAFITWFNKGNQIRITDDLSRQFWAIITSYQPQRRWSRNYPYRHDYTIDFLVVDWT